MVYIRKELRSIADISRPDAKVCKPVTLDYQKSCTLLEKLGYSKKDGKYQQASESESQEEEEESVQPPEEEEEEEEESDQPEEEEEDASASDSDEQASSESYQEEEEEEEEAQNSSSSYSSKAEQAEIQKATEHLAFYDEKSSLDLMDVDEQEDVSYSSASPLEQGPDRETMRLQEQDVEIVPAHVDRSADQLLYSGALEQVEHALQLARMQISEAREAETQRYEHLKRKHDKLARDDLEIIRGLEDKLAEQDIEQLQTKIQALEANIADRAKLEFEKDARKRQKKTDLRKALEEERKKSSSLEKKLAKLEQSLDMSKTSYVRAKENSEKQRQEHEAKIAEMHEAHKKEIAALKEEVKQKSLELKTRSDASLVEAQLIRDELKQKTEELEKATRSLEHLNTTSNAMRASFTQLAQEFEKHKSRPAPLPSLPTPQPISQSDPYDSFLSFGSFHDDIMV